MHDDELLKPSSRLADKKKNRVKRVLQASKDDHYRSSSGHSAYYAMFLLVAFSSPTWRPLSAPACATAAGTSRADPAL